MLHFTFRIQLENQGSSLSAAQYTATESSRRSVENGDGRHEFEATTRQPPRTDCEYTMLSQCTMVSPVSRAEDLQRKRQYKA